jgi:hypothetical protein
MQPVPVFFFFAHRGYGTGRQARTITLYRRRFASTTDESRKKFETNLKKQRLKLIIDHAPG